jgi:hypothetical protein
MALSTARVTQQRLDGSFNNLVVVGEKTSTTLYVGGIVCVDSTGYAVPGSSTTGLRVVGILGNQPALLPAPSYTNSGASGSVQLEVRQGTFKLNISSGDPVTVANMFNTVYIEDDQTICATGSGKSAAGVMVGLDGAESPTGPGVWVTLGQLATTAVGSAGPTGPTGPTGA